MRARGHCRAGKTARQGIEGEKGGPQCRLLAAGRGGVAGLARGGPAGEAAHRVGDSAAGESGVACDIGHDGCVASAISG